MPRRSGRRSAPGLVTAEEDGKGKVILGRRKAKPTAKATSTVEAEARANTKEEDKENTNESDVDPNEERYCICGDVSYGFMIACDNDSVSSNPFAFSRVEAMHPNSNSG